MPREQDRFVRRRLFFCHLQKTAGSSLIRRLRRHFDRERAYPPRFDGAGSVLSVARLLQHWRETGGALDLVAGHFPLCTQELLGGGFSTCTILREPVQRTLSFLRHHRKWTPQDRDKTLEEIYDDPARFHGLIHNHMVKMLSLTTSEMTRGALTVVVFTPDRLARAKAQLACVDVVGLQERFEDFCAELHHRFGIELGDPVVRNRTEPTVVSRSFRERIAADNAADIELYEWAQRLLRRKAGGSLTGTGQEDV
jgi:hypothetical protein